MRHAFISHNRADKATARLLAVALAEQGITPWFDEWDLPAGASLTGGIETGLSLADVFVLVWSEAASKSGWVGTELRAFLRRRVDNSSLRIVPVMVDGTPLPTLVADYKGFALTDDLTLEQIAYEIAGQPIDVEAAQILQRRLQEITARNVGNDPLPWLICPACGSSRLVRRSVDYRDDTYLVIDCEDCVWGEWTQ